MRKLIAQQLLEFDGRPFTVGDAVLAGLLSGRWQALERRIAVGLALAAEAEQRGAPADPAAVRAATVVFRRSRRLLAAEDLREWLEDRELGSGDLVGYATRTALRERDGASARIALAASRPAGRAVAAVMRAEALFDGTLGACAGVLVENAAAPAVLEHEVPANPALVDALLAAALAGPDRGLQGLPREELAERAAMACALAAARAEVAAAISPAAIDDAITAQRLDRTRLRFDEIALRTGDAAAEALLCVREDAMALGQVAAAAEVTCETREVDVASLDPELRPALVAARAGDLVGPVDGELGFRIVHLRERRSPSSADQALRRQVRTELVRARLERRAAGRVDWHGHI